MSDTLTFEDLTRLSGQEVQTLLREVDQKDLVLALKSASEELKDRILGNMSERVRGFIEEEMKHLGSIASPEIKVAQQRIVQQFSELKKQKRTKPKLSKRYLSMKRELKKLTQRPLLQLSYDEINQVFVGFGEIGKKEGILALESVIQGADEDFLNYGVRLAVDGTEPDLIMDILETWRESLLHEHKSKYQKVIEGIMAIQSGDNPRIIESKLKRLY